MIYALRTFKNWETWAKCFIVALIGFYFNDIHRTHFGDLEAFCVIFCIMVFGMYLAQAYQDQL